MSDIKIYKITDVQRRDEWGPIHGSMMQDYAVALEGEQGWIKLTQKVETKPPAVGDELQGYIEDKTNTSGSSYRKFKKENPQYAGAGRSGGQSSDDTKYIIQMLEEITGRRDVADQVIEPSQEKLDDPFEGMNI